MEQELNLDFIIKQDRIDEKIVKPLIGQAKEFIEEIKKQIDY